MRVDMRALLTASVLACAAAASPPTTDTTGADTPPDSTPPVTSVAKVSVDALRFLGRKVRFEGTVKEIIATGIPLKVLLKTGEYTWLASFYKTDSLPEGVIKAGNRVAVSGVLLNVSEVMYLGTKMKVPEVMASTVEKVKVKKKQETAKGK